MQADADPEPQHVVIGIAIARLWLGVLARALEHQDERAERARSLSAPVAGRHGGVEAGT